MHTDCGKIPYPNPAAAWRTLHSLSRPIALLSHKRLHKRGAIYRCEHCHAWHLTSRRPLKRPAGWKTMTDPLQTAKKRIKPQWLILDREEAP